METRANRLHAPALLACAAFGWADAGAAKAQSIEQGILQLEWGDPARPAPGRARLAPRFNAYLVKDDGSRTVLDPVQARRAAGDLYMLAHRRVAVAFAAPGAAKSTARGIDAIVPVDPTTRSAPVQAPGARVDTMLTRVVTVPAPTPSVAPEPTPEAAPPAAPPDTTAAAPRPLDPAALDLPVFPAPKGRR